MTEDETRPSEDERNDETDPFAELEAGAAGDGRDPFAELDGEAEAGGGGETESGADPEPGGAFESVDVDPVEVEDVWTSLAADETEEPEVSLGSDAESLDGADHRVPKREYCQRCPFFSDPPEVSCTNEGTTIVAVEDADHFRVRNCPMVEGPPPGGER